MTFVGLTDVALDRWYRNRERRALAFLWDGVALYVHAIGVLTE